MPWGVLSRYGLYQANERGRRLGTKYSTLLRENWAAKLPKTSTSTTSTVHHQQHHQQQHTHEKHHHAHNHNLIEAYSSNFNRTQLSCAGVLDGFLYTFNQTLHNYPSLQALWTPPVIPITIAPSNVCPIGVFDSGNGIMAHARTIFAGPVVRNREEELKSYSSTLIQAIPYFQIPPTAYTGNNVNQSTKVSAAPTPIHFVGDTGDKTNRFLWIRAFDYLHTSSQHLLTVPQTIQQYEYIANKHLVWRFRTLFSHHPILALASRNLLNIILSNIEEDIKKLSTPSSSHTSSALPQFPVVRLFSGHDVTIMPLLYAMSLNAPHSVIKIGYPSGKEIEVTTANDINYQVPWPNYSSSLSFELYEISNNNYSIEWCFENERLPRGTDISSPVSVMKDEEILYMKGTLTIETLRKIIDYIESVCPREI